MIDANIALNRLGISTTCAMHAVQQAREYVEGVGEPQQIDRMNDLLEKVLGVKLTAPDIMNRPVTDARTYAMTIVQAVIDNVVKADGAVDDADEMFAAAKERAYAFITRPSNSWMFAVAAPTEVSTTAVAVATSVDVKVEVKSDGSIKKGGKEILAIALYEKHVKNAAAPATNQEFIAILMSELGMTKAGATTYNYNMKKKFGGTIVAKGQK